MVFRKENKGDSFQRQMSALRQQIGGGDEPAPEQPTDQQRYAPERDTSAYGGGEFASAETPRGEERHLTATAPPMPELPPVDDRTTVIAYDTTWKGEIQSVGTVHVHGRFEGSIRATDVIYVADEADVDATLTATNVIIAGLIKGTVRCDARFEVLPSGRVSGDVQAPTLVVHEGAVVTGQLRMGATEPSEAKPTPVVQRRTTRGTA
jgi:cytoskeletal protein CcmA (bactofilin family)